MENSIGKSELLAMGLAFLLLLGLILVFLEKDKVGRKKRVLMLIPAVYFATQAFNVLIACYDHNVHRYFARLERLVRLNGGWACVAFEVVTVLCLLIVFFMKGSSNKKQKEKEQEKVVAVRAAEPSRPVMPANIQPPVQQHAATVQASVQPPEPVTAPVQSQVIVSGEEEPQPVLTPSAEHVAETNRVHGVNSTTSYTPKKNLMRKSFENALGEKLVITEDGMLLSTKKGNEIIERTQLTENLKQSIGALVIKRGKKLDTFSYLAKNKEEMTSAVAVLNSMRTQPLVKALTLEDFGIVVEPLESDKAKAILAAVKPAVANQLKAPASAQFPEELITITTDGEDIYNVSGYVDSQNGYGAMIRNDFAATVTMTGGTPVVKAASVGTKKAVSDAKEFGKNYVAIMIMTGIGGAILYFIINLIVEGKLPSWILFFI